MKNFRLDVKKVIEKEKLSMQSGSSVTFLSASFITADSGSIIQFHSPILIPVASASVSRPGAGTGSLYVKSADNKIYFQTDNGTEYDLTDTGGGGGSPGGSDTQVQYNDGGSFGGAADLTFNDSTGDVTVGASTGDAKLFFRDSGIYAYSKADGELDIVSDTRLGLTGSGDLPSAIGILASAGGIDIDAVGAAGQDINITNTGGSVNITATEDVINAVSITSNSIYFNGGDQDDAYLFYSKPLYLDIVAKPGTTLGKIWNSSGYILNWGGLGMRVTGSGHFNTTGGDYDFRVQTNNSEYAFFTDGGTDQVGIGLADSTEWAAASAQTDTNVYVSGTIDSRGTAVKGTTVYGGDVHVSGNLSVGGTGGFVHLETQDGGGAAFTPTATTIPAGYRDIIITGNAIGTGVATGMWLRLYFNGDDTDANYRSQFLNSYTGNNVSGYGASFPYILMVRTTGEGTESSSGFAITIPDYSNTANRAVASSIGTSWREVAGHDITQQLGVIWRGSTAAITSIIFDADATLAAGSSFTVWVR